jgi:hypothetical protein
MLRHWLGHWLSQRRRHPGTWHHYCTTVPHKRTFCRAFSDVVSINGANVLVLSFSSGRMKYAEACWNQLKLDKTWQNLASFVISWDSDGFWFCFVCKNVTKIASDSSDESSDLRWGNTPFTGCEAKCSNFLQVEPEELRVFSAKLLCCLNCSSLV